MKSVGSGDDDSHGKCPKCKQFIERVGIMAYRVDSLQHKLDTIRKFLTDNEWVFIENAENLKTIHDMKDVDTESFEKTCHEIIQFGHYIDKVSRALETANNEADNFCRERDD
jgi:hypothetical protein